MNIRTPLMFVFLGTLCFIIGWRIGSQTSTTAHVSPRTTADYIHAVVEADRTFYTQNVVERMEAMLIVTSSENWRKEKGLPLPAQFLQEASRNIHVSGKPFHYQLFSLWPINPNNGPMNEKERRELEQVVKYGEVIETEVELDQQRYFQAIYPDRAVSRACISCHNSHPKSPKQNFNLNDVMGGLKILIPIND